MPGRLRACALHVVDHPLVAHKLTALRDETHRLPDVPAAGRRAGDAARLRGDPRRARRAVRHRHAGGAHDRRPALAAQAARRADPARRARHARRHDAAAADRRGRLPRHDPRRGDAGGDARTPTGCPTTCPAGRCYVLDPMLATGGTLAAAIRFLIDRGADDVTAICLLAAPEGVRAAGGDVRGPTRRSPSSPPASTSGSTRRATSCRASATPATGSTASSDRIRWHPVTCSCHGHPLGREDTATLRERHARRPGEGSQGGYVGLAVFTRMAHVQHA